MLESWIQDTVNSVLLSWIWSWMHAVVSIDETMDLLGDLFVSNISLLRKMLEVWVLNSIDGVLFSWVWSWVHAVVSVDETVNSLLNLLVSNIGVALLGKG